jgi:glycosyltransferase involved in cell wall biosynthesis
MSPSKIRILAPHFVDVDNFNAQSLNLREIATRLDPGRFQCTAFYAHEPDSRLVGLPHVRLRRIPERLGSLVMLGESLRGYNILFNPSISMRFVELYFRLPELVRKRTATVQWIEGVIRGNLADAGPAVQRNFNRFGCRLDAYVAITDYVAHTSFDDYGIKAETVIPIGVDAKTFSPVRREARDRIRVLFVGHLIERKGPDLVLEAAKVLRDVDFCLVGRDRGNYRQTLERIVQDNQLTNVCFSDPMPQAQLARLMGEHDILLHPSRVEGMPKVVVEAAATGLPAVIFDAYRAPVVADGITGYQVKTFEEMLARLKQLIEDEPLRRKMGEAAVKYAHQFDWDIVVKQWEAVFLKVARAHS